MNWRQAKKRYPQMRPYSDDDFDGLVNSRDCKPLNTSKDGLFGRAVGVLTGGKFGQTAEQYQEEKVEKKTTKEYEHLARQISERELAKPKVEEEVKKQLEEKGYLSADEEEAIRKKIEGREELKRGPIGKTYRAVEGISSYIEKKMKKISVPKRGSIISIPKARTVVRKAPISRSPTRRSKKPSSIAIQKRMAELRTMKKQPVYRQRIPMKRVPTSVRELQNTQNLRSMLPEHERQRIDGLAKSFQKSAAIDFLRRQLREKELMAKRQKKDEIRMSRPMFSIEKDIMTGRERIKTQPRKEAWLS